MEVNMGAQAKMVIPHSVCFGFSLSVLSDFPPICLSLSL